MWCNFSNAYNNDCKKQQKVLNKVLVKDTYYMLCDSCMATFQEKPKETNPRLSLKEHKANMLDLLNKQEKPVTQQDIQAITGLSLSVISNTLNSLKYEQKVRVQTFSDGSLTRPKKYYATNPEAFKSFLRHSFKSRSMSFKETYFLKLIKKLGKVTINDLCKELRKDKYKVSKAYITSCLYKLVRYKLLSFEKVKTDRGYQNFYFVTS